jgi:cytochrome c biogenesis factor
MSDLWVPVIAALGSAALTGIVAFGIEWWRSSRAEKTALAERRARAYSMLLAQAGVIVFIAHGLHIMMETRSRLREGLNVTLGRQKPIDLLELSDRLRANL